MPPTLSALLVFVAALFQSRAALYLEHLALRHQLAVYQQTIARPRLRPTDRLFWAWLSRIWPAWQSALAFVQPRTVIAWQRSSQYPRWGDSIITSNAVRHKKAFSSVIDP
jgi:putative transposase